MRKSWIIGVLMLIMLPLWAEYQHPDILSFEDGTAPVVAHGGKVSLSREHTKHGKQSLCWEWKGKSPYLSFHAPIAYERVKTVNSDNSLYSFIFWLYLPQPYEGSVRFEFLKQGRVCCYFDYGTHFSGWSGAWLAFRRDMQGTPEEGMDELRIHAPASVAKGRLYLDHIILSSLQDSRHHTADLQAPYINPKTESHWLVLLRSWQDTFDLPLPDAVSSQQQADMKTIESRMEQLLLPKKAVALSELRRRYATYHFAGKAGLPIYFERYGEAYEHWDRTTGYTQKIGEMGLSKANKLLLDLAVAYCLSEDDYDREDISRMFCTLTRHMLDQGFRAGSAMGTLHHLGYSMRNYYPAMFLMRSELAREGLLSEVQAAMEWFSGVGEVKHAPTVAGMDIDAFNTSLQGRLMSILMLPDSPYRVRYLTAFSRWVDNGYRYSDGLRGSFKVDGTIFHHCNHYPAYAVGGLDGAVNALWLLHHTEWAVSPESHTILRQSLLAMRFYCNDQTWPLSLSGRHPDGKGHLLPRHYKRLSLCGTPDGKRKVDLEVRDALKNSPTGNRAFPYSCLLVHRRDRWMVTVKGHSRYIWNTETYEGCNLYGRYLNYGNVQILATGDTISNFSSGFRQEGWDWAHWPGTTATVLPIDSLRARINNLDNNSGFEEMLQSDRAFCNGMSMDGQGVWGMQLHSHDKYDGSLYANKSVFCFDHRIICLGSDIRSRMNAPTHTTLYQVAQRPGSSPRPLYEDTYGNRWILRDSAALYYYEGIQHSRHEETDAPTSGRFRTLAIDHGIAPTDGHYEYVITVQDTTSTADEILDSYRVLRCDSTAHIVTDLITGITAYVLWQPGAMFGNSRPCLVMTLPTTEGVRVSVADPDLHLYEGPSDETYLSDGRRKERIIYSYPWKDHPSAESTIDLFINGDTIHATCQHGMANEYLVERL